MIVHSQIWNNVLTSVYILKIGEKVGCGRHRHAVNHSTQCVKGAAIVEIFSDPPRAVVLRDGAYMTLPRNIDHDITAAEDDTIVVNCINAEIALALSSPRAEDGKAGNLIFGTQEAAE